MRRLRELIVRLGGFFNKQRKDRELDDEIESHLEMHVASESHCSIETRRDAST